MFAHIAYFEILGQPLVVWMGIFTYILFIITALMPKIVRSRKFKITIYWHWRLVYVAIALATIHALLIILSK